MSPSQVYAAEGLLLPRPAPLLQPGLSLASASMPQSHTPLDSYKIRAMAAEIAKAIAWLESIGLVHGDRRRPKMLLDQRGHLELTDFRQLSSSRRLRRHPWSAWR
ncbi:hypothetical protein LMH87_005028 [Akanthomyces muscarius]|uniref:Protein kinase domain-containing protein n=1 Tax=Akanthomyces muscarius TaxID=2231603 RepID=A0A9W8QKY6_AKAMU|nr:hypothetical protein LMH87_005028 [Akanthomyces muscarius]KAJ4163288.1 hypothetical protein LMH87_005028 [Akanthomyces muscarius]